MKPRNDMNSNLKNRLQNHETSPEPEVWSRIEKKLKMRSAAPKIAVFAAVALAGAAAIMIFAHTNKSEVADTALQNEVFVAQNESMPQTDAAIAEVVENNTVNQVMAQNESKETSQETQIKESMAPTAVNEVANASTVSNSSVNTNKTASATPTTKPAVAQASVTLNSNMSSTTRSTKFENVDNLADNTIVNAKSGTNNNPGGDDEDDTEITDPALWIPTAFMPESSDWENSSFRVKSNDPDNVKAFEMRIYNRAGQQVFATKDMNQAWDGKFKGNTLPQAAYVYVISYRDGMNRPHSSKGTILLVR